ncbi:MAG: hypothetical protein GY847_33775 [Proteobacteria bacterium]|nr:hypothetical protein [Pseudomonadota bacterium]
MRTMFSKKRFVIFFAIGVALFLGKAAMANPDSSQTKALQLNQQAMDAYSKLKISKAMQLLQQATDICMKNDIRSEVLARTYINIGVVEAGGNQNNAAAMEYFKKGLCIDPKILLDPLNATPETETLFNMARNQAQAPGGCSGGPPAAYPQPRPPAPTPPSQPPGPRTLPASQPPPPPPTGLLRHQPVNQQLRLVPVPLFVEINPTHKVGQVVLFYRTLGERIFQQVPMKQHTRGYAATIGCDVLQTFDPTGLEYYIAVFDAGNQLLGTAGTEAQPHQIAIVQSLTTPPPALPTMAPPPRCMEECPPWKPNCNKSCKPFGEMCDSPSECCSGVCFEEMCMEGDDSGGGGGFGGDDKKPIFRLAISFGTGMGLVPGGDIDPYNQNSKTPSHILIENNMLDDPSQNQISTSFAWSKFHARLNAMFYLTSKLMLGVAFRGGLALSAEEDVLPLAPAALASFGYRLVGDGDDKFELDTLVGIGGGVIQHRIPYEDCQPYRVSSDTGHSWHESDDQGFVLDVGCTETALDNDNIWNKTEIVQKSFFRQAGKMVIEVGVDSYIWFIRNFGMNIGVIADVFLVPDFALNFDFQLGLAVRF